MAIPDSVLAKEYSLVMERAYAFEPIEGNLTHWKGFVPAITDEGERFIEIEINLPNNYPEVPPIVQINSPITHPNMTSKGILEMRMLARWRPSYHLFQVIVEIMRLFAKVPARCDEELKRIDPQSQLTPLKSQQEQLSVILSKKKEELEDIKSKKVGQITNRALQQEKQIFLADEILNVEGELFAIEQQFEDYDISSHEFAKRYFNLKKRLYLLQAKS